MSRVLIIIAVVQVLTILANLLRSKGLAMLLGPSGFGVVSTIDQVIVTLVAFGAFALPFTAMKHLAQANSQGEEPFRKVGTGFLQLLATLALAMTALASLVIAFAPGLFGDDLAPFQGVLQVAVLGVPAAMLTTFGVNVLASAQRAGAAAVANFIVATALATAAVLGAAWKGLDGLYWLNVAAALGTTVLGLVYIGRRHGVRLRLAPSGIVRTLRESPQVLTHAAAFYAMMCATSLALLVVRTTVLSKLGPSAVGQLQGALSISLTVGAVLMPISNLYLAPLVNRDAPLETKARIAHDFVSRMLVLFALGALPVVLYPGILLRMLYSPEFLGAASALWMFVLWQCVFQVAYVYQMLIVGLDDVTFAALTSVVGAVIGVALSFPLVDQFGIGGVAVGLAIGMAVVGIAFVLRLRLRFDCEVPVRPLLRFSCVAGALITAGQLFAHRPEYGPGALWPRLCFAVAVIVALWLLLDKAERSPRQWLASARRG